MMTSIFELNQLFEKKALSPLEHLQSQLDRIEKYNPHIRAFVQINEEEAIKAAKEAERKFMAGENDSPLQGITVGVKDVIHTRDAPVTMETQLYYENPIYPKEDAFAVKQLRKAGAVIVGKTNTHEMGMGPTGDVGYSGHARNPHDLSKVTGGSSSGSAAALPGGLCDVTLGSDTGGSIRLPSALSGTVGMKPTFGRVSNTGFSPLAYSCDAIGPMTTSVRDNAYVLEAISAFDPSNMRSKSFSNNDFLGQIGSPVKGMKLAVPYNWLDEPLDEEMRKNFLDSIKILEDLGLEILDARLPSRKDLAGLRQAHQTVLISEGFHAHQEELAHPGKFAQAIYDRLLTGNTQTVDYLAAYQRKQDLLDLYAKVYQEADLLISPAVVLPACDLYQTELTCQGQAFTTMEAYTEFTWLDSFSGLPSLALPTGFNQDGLPMGILINGPYGQEAKIYQLASQLEATLNLDLQANLEDLD